ncbi:hypothetical protein RUM43_006472 [Polyplax serrata]|uniref:Apoptosis-inducing factor 1, mitochondrial n=1 Tax=Polyplax serrata TaxID=468196 RepID=A0AAN8PYS0_POLSC
MSPIRGHIEIPAHRRYASDDGGKSGKGGKGSKSIKGTTAKVEECLPAGSQKKLPAAAVKTCPPPPKIKIPSCAPVKPPAKVCCTKTDVCDHQPKYDACRAGGLRNPVVQVCKKPNMMEDCCKKPLICPEDPKESKRKFIRNLFLSLLFLALFSFANESMYKVLKKDELVTFESQVPKKKKRRKRIACKNPPTSRDLPESVPYLLIGGGTAAFSAFRSIKSMDPTAQVLVVSKEFEYPYMRPPLSKEMWFNNDPADIQKLMFKQWNGTIRSIYYEPKNFYTDIKELSSSTKGGVTVMRGWAINKIDPYAKTAWLDDGTPIKYEKCLIATGNVLKLLRPINKTQKRSPGCTSLSFQRSPPEVKEMVQTYRDVFDFQDLNEVVEESQAIAVVGGGFLGSELACALARYGKEKGLKVYQIFKESGNMGKILPEYLSLWTTKKVEAEGVTVLANSQVVDAFVGEKKLNLILNSGERLIVDHCVTAIGATPNTSLAKPSELETDDELGGYLVNAELEARSNLYIAGDAACFYDVKLGRRRIEHHDHAVVSGRLAGENMVGAAKPYWHQSMFWSDLGPEVGYEAIGIVDASLPTVGVFAKKTDKDTPEAVVAATGDNIRSQTEAEAAPIPPAKGSPKPPQPGEDYGKGIIFYLRDETVVGIVMWNVFNRMQIARQVLKDERKYDNLNEVAKLFNIHEE